MIDERRPRGPGPGPGPDRFGDRGGFRDRGGPPPPRPFGGASQHTLRLREGDRELEVSGSPEFVRQTLNDLPVLLARLRGEAAPRASISLPPPPAPVAAASAPPPPAAPAAPPAAEADIESEVLAVLRGSRSPLTVAEIRKRLDGSPSGQLVRRTLERNSAVTASMDRPARYRIRK